MSTSQPTKPLAANLSHNFTHVEENAIYYTICIVMYIIKKLFLQYKTHESQRGNRIFILVKTTVSSYLVTTRTVPAETNDTYLDYVKVWTTTTDCGGLTHQCF